MIKINSEVKWKNSINEKKLKVILKTFISHLFGDKFTVFLYITGDNEIQKLNKKFRNKDTPTDILSWTYHEINSDFKTNTPPILAGEIVISADRIQEQSKVNGWDFTTELVRILAHGCVHIFGLDHERSEKENQEMLKLEIKLLKIIGINNIY